jgi:hypothetical protein
MESSPLEGAMYCCGDIVGKELQLILKLRTPESPLKLFSELGSRIDSSG